MTKKKTLQNIISSFLLILIGLYFSTSLLDKLEYSFLNNSSKIITIIICIVFIIYIVLSPKKFMKYFFIKNKFKYLIILFFCILLISNIYVLVFTSYQTKSDFIALLQLLIMTGLILSIDFSDKNISILTKIWIFSSLIIAILVINYNMDNINRNKIIFLNGYYDPNILSASLIPALLIALNYSISNIKNKLLFITYFITFALILISIVITGSRGSLIGALIGIIFLLLHIIKTSRLSRNLLHSKRNIFMLLIGIGLIFCMIIIFVPQETLIRFNPVRLIVDGGSARIQIWTKALNIFFDSNPIKIIFGFGTGTFKFIAGTNIVQADGWISANIASHNIFIRVLFENGFLGLVILVLIFYVLITTFVKNKEFLSLSIIASYLVIGMTLDLTITRYFWNAIIFTIISSNALINNLSCEKMLFRNMFNNK